MAKARYLIILHMILALFSVGAIFSKKAALEETLSLNWIIYYGIVLFILFVYAIAWQQIIKKMPIVTAYANKAVLVIWGIIWGLIIFGEAITLTKILGVIIIIAGVYLVVTGDEYNGDKEDVKE
ncbi:MAG: EamA family transporter [Lachnospiraceae bacterium]|nr:EamA family transporter [Lachnospiraceae bacterium]